MGIKTTLLKRNSVYNRIYEKEIMNVMDRNKCAVRICNEEDTGNYLLCWRHVLVTYIFVSSLVFISHYRQDLPPRIIHIRRLLIAVLWIWPRYPIILKCRDDGNLPSGRSWDDLYTHVIDQYNEK